MANVEHLRKFKRLFEYINSIGNNSAYAKQLRFLNQQVNKSKLTTNKEYRNVYNSILALRPAPANGVHIHTFWGLGCTSNMNGEVSNYISRHVNSKFNIQEIGHCNPSISKSLKHVALQCVTPFGPRITQYLMRKKQSIIRSLQDPTVKRVYLVGHSYGGLAVNMLCKMLRNDPDAKKKLYAITFGTIYRAKPESLVGVRIKQYMYIDDVALRCQRIRIPMFNANSFNSQGITWLKPRQPYKKPSRMVLWGTRNEWVIHNDYPVNTLTAKYIRETVN